MNQENSWRKGFIDGERYDVNSGCFMTLRNLDKSFETFYNCIGN